jgi:hypothetical protein
MGKGPPFAQNDEVASDLVARDTAAPGEATARTEALSSRQRPEEILAQTLSRSPHPEATDGWAAQRRRIFLIAMAAAGVILVVAGLLVTRELAPGTGRPAPVETGPGTGLANQLLETSAGSQTGGPPPSTDIAIPIPSTPTTRPARAVGGASPSPIASLAPTAQPNAQQPTTATTQPPSPTTTVPCGGLIGQGLQQIQLPCQSSTRSTSPLG